MIENKNKVKKNVHALSVDVEVQPENKDSNNGVISLKNLKGKAPFKFHWHDGPTTQNREHLAHGVYGLTIIDGNGNEATIKPEIMQVAALKVPKLK